MSCGVIMDEQVKVNIFKNNNFNLLFAGVLVSNIAHVLFNFAISLYILRIAKEAFGVEQAALIQAAYLAVSGIILLVCMPFGGVLADKMNKVRIMYLTDYIRGITIGLVSVAVLFIDHAGTLLIILFIMNVILGINSSLFNPASGSLLRFIVKDEELQQASSYMQGSANLQNIIGLILGGIIFATLGIFWIFVINAIGYVISAISEMFIRYDHKAHTTDGEEITLHVVMDDMKSGITYLFGAKAILATILMALGINFFLSPIFSNAIPIFIEFGLGEETRYLFDSFLTRETWYSIISVSFSVSSIIMALILSTKRTKESYSKQFKSAILWVVIVITFNSAVMISYYLDFISIDFTLLGITLSMFLAGFFIMNFNIPMSLVIQRNVEPRQLGKVSSVMNVLSQALIPIGSMLAGVIISQLSIIYFFVFVTVGAWIVVLIYINNKVSNEI